MQVAALVWTGNPFQGAIVGEVLEIVSDLRADQPYEGIAGQQSVDLSGGNCPAADDHTELAGNIEIDGIQGHVF